MAFLDNSGDIILDAVLTDTGRARLAKGDGSFRIVKFALGDDEIDYSQYRNSNHPEGASPSGSAYYDLDILMTPILEAFTNNTSSMKSMVLSIPRNNLLYLPVLKINDKKNGYKTYQGNGYFYVAVDEETEDVFVASAQGQEPEGVLFGENSNANGGKIRIDQGLDTTEISPEFTIDNDLIETQYIVEMDNRLGSVLSISGAAAAVSFIDDDNIASYYFSLNASATDAEVVTENTSDSDSPNEVIAGPRGTTIEMKIRSSLELNTSDYTFETIGNLYPGEGDSSKDLTASGTNWEYYYIDSNVRVTGATTGYSIDIPVRFIKITGNTTGPIL
jgi:hypothetical protein